MQVDARLAEVDDCLYRLAIRVFVFHEGKVLLVREKDAGWWGFPGGGVDYGEDIYEALPGELAEELGVSAADIKTDYQAVYVATGAVVHGVPRANLFYCVDIPVDHVRSGSDVFEFGWFVPADITPEVVSRYIGSSADEAVKFAEIIEKLAAR